VLKLARLAGFSEQSTWLALAGLAGRGMIEAKRTDDVIDARITPKGRRGL
jgi:hypothetical protein